MSRGKRRDDGPIKVSEAEGAFVAAASRELPGEAFRELFSSDPEDVAEWARRWRVDVPCMLAFAASLQDLARADADDQLADQLAEGTFRLDTAASYRVVPRAWREQLSRVNQLGASPYRRDPLGEIMTAREADERLDSLQLAAPEWSRRRREVRAALAESRHRAQTSDDALRPIAADPVAESRQEFVQRAVHHYNSRAALAESLGAPLYQRHPSPKLHTHARWLVRNHLRRESYDAIADAENVQGADPAKAVEAAIRTFAALIGLRRGGRRGRPRKASLENPISSKTRN